MRPLITAVVATTLTVATTADAQRQRNNQPGQRTRPNTLSADAPDIGDPLPDVTVHTETGDELRMSALKGKYTILVFGCLT